MRYELGNMDKCNLSLVGTVMENTPLFKATLDENVDAERLMNAVKTALEYHPLFKCKLSLNKQYFLEDNENAEIILFNTDTDSRPKEYGKNTNGYLFRICYFENTVSLEWCHTITDGRGAIRFFSTLLDAYFGVELPEVPVEFPLNPGFESVYDKSVKPIGQIKQPKGFKPKDMPVIDNGFKCTSHILKAETSEVMRVAKKIDATPAAILVPLFCRAVRLHLPENVKNRNVSCGILVDCRGAANMDTMHNFISNKVITYQDKFDAYDLPTLSTVYRGILDLFVQPENIAWACTESVDSTDFLFRVRPKKLLNVLSKIIAKIYKRSMNNIAFTYLGRVPFSEEVKSHLTDFNFRTWTDVADCVLAAADLNGTLIIDVCENYADKGVVDSFIEICRDFGMNVEEAETTVFEQANLSL